MTNKPESFPHNSSNLYAAYTRFFQALCEPGIEPLIEAAYEIFNRPILLTDENYRLLTQYPRIKIGSDIWDALYDTQTLPPETILEYQDAFLTGSGAIYEPFYSDWGLAQQFPRIFGEVYTKNHTILGHFAIFMMGMPLQEHDLGIAKIFAQALQIRMSMKDFTKSSRSHNLADLLNPDSALQLKQLAQKNLSRSITKNFCIAVTPIGNTAAQKSYAATAINQLTASFSDTVSTVFEDSIVTLFGKMNPAAHTAKERSFLEFALRSLKMIYGHIGISDNFSDLTDTYCYFQQAYYSALIKKSGVIFFSDVTPDPIFACLLQKTLGKTFLHPALNEIYQYDQSHKTDYFETLKQYSLCMHNKDLAADKLCIHRNTLLYRLNRISELFSISFEEQQTALYLLNSFQIWDISNSLTPHWGSPASLP